MRRTDFAANRPLLLGRRASINNAMQVNHSHLSINRDSLTGSTEKHLVEWQGCASPFLVHGEVIDPLNRLVSHAAEHGFQLRLCSSFRSFDRQLKIWNDKVLGLRPVYNDDGAVIDLSQLSEWQQAQAILRWSALPGTSRHHWGTDFDIYDAAAVDSNYRVQLTPDEVEGDGVFAPMHNWLDTLLVPGAEFYRPYALDKGGIAPERWHISYRPLAEQFAAKLNTQLIAERIEDSQILLRDVVLAHLDEIYQRYIQLRD